MFTCEDQSIEVVVYTVLMILIFIFLLSIANMIKEMRHHLLNYKAKMGM